MKKRADGRYQKSVLLSSGKRKLVYGRTIAEVNAAADALRDADRQGLVIDDNTLVGEWAQKWFQTYKTGLRASTLVSYKNSLNSHILPLLGNIRVKDVKPINCQEVMRVCSNKAEDTQRKVMHTMQQLFKAAVQNGLILRNPADGLSITPITRGDEKKDLTPDEQDALVAAVSKLDDPRALRLVAVCLYAGLRREEALGLEWVDIDAEGLHVRRAYGFPTNNQADPDHALKSKAAYRTVPVPNKLRRILGSAPRDSIFVIGNAGGKEPTLTGFRRLWQKIAAVSPVPGLHIHMLRHSYITNLWRAGVDLKTAQVWAGHSNISVTAKIYTHAEDAHKGKPAETYLAYIDAGGDRTSANA